MLVAVGTPRANGQIESSNRTILNALRTMINEDERRWDEQVKLVQSAINSAPNSTTGVSPTSLVLAFKPKDIVQNETVAVFTAEKADGIPREELRERVANVTRRNQTK